MSHSRKSFPLMIAVLFSALTFTPQLGADIADDIYAACSAELLATVVSCEDNIQKKAENCVERIEFLLALGKTNTARRSAELCMLQINQDTRDCIQSIELLRSECEVLLLQYNAIQLNDFFRVAANVARDSIRDARVDARDMLVAALSG